MCTVIEMKKGEMVCNDGIVLSNGEEMKAFDDTGYKYLGVLQLDKILNQQMKEKIKAEYIRRVKMLCRSMLNSVKVISRINGWAVNVVSPAASLTGHIKKCQSWTEKHERS